MKKRKKKRYRLKKWVKKTLLVLLILIIILVGIKIFKKYYVPKVKTPEPIITDISKLVYKYKNDDIKARLVISSIDLDAIITKTVDNEYYLKHNIYKKKSKFGNPFFDYRQNDDLYNEKQINIYGHNLTGKWSNKTLPFSKLTAYLEKDNNYINDKIILYTDNNTFNYQLLAIKVITDEVNEHMMINTSNDDLWKEHIKRLMMDTKYCLGDCHIEDDDKLLIIQTCNFEPKDTYLIVIAKMINNNKD